MVVSGRPDEMDETGVHHDLVFSRRSGGCAGDGSGGVCAQSGQAGGGGDTLLTLKQKQALLAYLGFYDGPLDWLWGEKSQRAVIDFQRAYMEREDVNGIFWAATEKRILLKRMWVLFYGL